MAGAPRARADTRLPAQRSAKEGSDQEGDVEQVQPDVLVAANRTE